MQSSKPVQAGIMVGANYDKNSGGWPIIVPIRQTRRVITCQVLKINTVLVKYLGLHVPCKYRGPRGYYHMSATILLPWVLEAFRARFPVSASSEIFVASFLLTRICIIKCQSRTVLSSVLLFLCVTCDLTCDLTSGLWSDL